MDWEAPFNACFYYWATEGGPPSIYITSFCTFPSFITICSFFLSNISEVILCFFLIGSLRPNPISINPLFLSCYLEFSLVFLCKTCSPYSCRIDVWFVQSDLLTFNSKGQFTKHKHEKQFWGWKVNGLGGDSSSAIYCETENFDFLGTYVICIRICLMSGFQLTSGCMFLFTFL